MSSSDASVAFVPFATYIDPTFWSEVNKRKVNVWKLKAVERRVVASYSLHGKQPTGCSMHIGHDSFDVDERVEGNSQTIPHVEGDFLLTNTYKEFAQELDRKAILETCTKKLWAKAQSKEWLKAPNLLNYFYLTAYADIKQCTYYYWNCIPAFIFPQRLLHADSPTPLPQNSELHRVALAFQSATVNWVDPFWIINGKAVALHAIETPEFSTISSSENVVLVFPNACSLPLLPAWTLRNLLAAIAALRTDWTALKVLALRKPLSECFLMHIKWDLPKEFAGESLSDYLPKCVGWERDGNELTHKRVELKSMFDPLQVLEQSVDLNLKLIRWRQAPSIDLDRFINLKVLILGSGTLGCNLARSLLGWGVRNFTFVDHANISFNNPIRQSLFTFADAQHDAGNHNKAAAAAAALKAIFPLVNARGVDMKVPMPGHPYSDNEKQKVMDTCQQLEALIEESNVVLLVMDSRESRWLPTLIAAARNKLAITVALGFDSYVVIRHGVSSAEAVGSSLPSSPTQSVSTGSVVAGRELGCYFCSDVTAPGNSLADRSLDQQCTISRSGISMISAGMAVELLASVIQHPLGAAAPALLAEVDESSSLLGGTPHQLRGFLSRFHQMTPTVRRFDKCSACGTEVRARYSVADPTARFRDFLHPIFQDSATLERLTGLSDLRESVNDLQLDMLEMEDDESIGST